MTELAITSSDPKALTQLRASWILAVPTLDFPAQLAAGLCIGKVLTAAAALLFLFMTQNSFAAVVTGAAILFDIADGVIFKRSRLAGIKRWSDRRRIYDSVTDRIVVALVITPMYLLGQLPAVFVGLVIVRELLTTVTNALPYYQRGIVFDANTPGRIGLLLIGIQSILSMNGIAPTTLMYMSVTVASCCSVFLYYRAMRRVMSD